MPYLTETCSASNTLQNLKIHYSSAKIVKTFKEKHAFMDLHHLCT